MTSTPASIGVGFFMLILLLLVAIGLVIALRGRARAVVVGSILAVLVLVFLGLFVGRETHVASERFVQQRAIANLSTAIAVSPDAQPWSSQAGPEFLADVYPSAADAAAALARSMVAELNNPYRPEVIVVAGPAEADVLGRVAVALREADAAQAVEVNPKAVKAPEPAEEHTRTALLMVEQVTQQASPQPAGFVQVHTGNGSARTARYVEKPWLANLDLFQSREPGRRWIVAGSDRACSDSHMAEELALRIAATRLAEEVCAAGPGIPGRGVPGNRPEGLNAAIAAQLQRQGLVADRFAQVFSRPYGGVYQGWVLVSARPEEIHRVAQGLMAPVRQAKQSLLARTLSVAALLAVIGLLYLFLSIATRGYYVRSLRVVAIILAVIGVLFVISIV